MDYSLAIDQGTHASRALVFDGFGRCVASHLLPVTLVRPQPDRAEQDPSTILATVMQTTATALQALSPAQRRTLMACGITTQRSTVLAWHRDGTPVSPALSWQDTRGAAQIAALQREADNIRQLSGLPLSAHYGASKLHWLERSFGNRDDLHYGPLAAFLLYRLTDRGRCEVDHANAQRMQLLDIHTRDWSPALIDSFDVSADRLPACRPVIHDYGLLAPHGIPVTAVSGDQNAAWFGNGPVDDDTALVNLGSGAFILAARPLAGIPPALLTSLALSEGQEVVYLAEATVNGAGSALQWLQPDAGSAMLDTLAAWLKQERSPPLFINSVGGLGSPWWRSDLQPAFVAEGRDAALPARAVAVVESILFLLQANLALLQRQRPLKRLRVSGGLARVTPLCQKLADLSGLPVERCGFTEASARGIAWLATGRPAHWPTSDGTERFIPESDPALQDRYRRFHEHLQHSLESCADD